MREDRRGSGWSAAIRNAGQYTRGSEDFLADQVQLGRPVFLPLQLVIAVANPAHIAGERVVPHVDDVLGIVRPRQAPLHCFAADGDVAQPRFHPAQYFIAPKRRPDEIGLRFVQLHQAILKRGQPEEIILLRDQLPGAPADRAIRRLLGIGNVKIVVDAVAALVEILVDVTGIARLQKQPPHGPQVLGGCGADEMRVPDAKLVPQASKDGEFRSTSSRGVMPSLAAARATFSPCSSVPVRNATS